jgi:hypothetical protein
MSKIQDASRRMRALFVGLRGDQETSCCIPVRAYQEVEYLVRGRGSKLLGHGRKENRGIGHQPPEPLLSLFKRYGAPGRLQTGSL